jgi:hypothetical protein
MKILLIFFLFYSCQNIDKKNINKEKLNETIKKLEKKHGSNKIPPFLKSYNNDQKQQ